MCPVEQIIIDKLVALKCPELTLTNWVCSKWGKVFPVDGAPYSKSKTSKPSTSEDTASSSSVNGPSESKPSTTSKPRKATSQADGKKGQSSFAANLQKAFW